MLSRMAGSWVVAVLVALAGACAGGPDPASLVLLGSVNAAVPGAFGVRVDGDRAYVNTTYGAMVVALGDGSAPAIVSEFESPPRTFDRARATALSRGFFYSAHSSRVDILDVRDPARPVVASQFAGKGLILSLEVVGNRLFVADESEGASAWDLSDPAKPTKVAQVSTGGTQGLAADASRLFVARSGWLTSYTYSGDTFTEASTVQFAPGSGAVAFALSAGRLFVSGDVWLGEWNVTDPAAPRMVTSAGVGVVAPGSGRGATLAGGHFYEARTAGAAFVYDVASPDEWKLVTELAPAQIRPTAYDVSVGERFVVVAHDDGVLVFGAR